MATQPVTRVTYTDKATTSGARNAATWGEIGVNLVDLSGSATSGDPLGSGIQFDFSGLWSSDTASSRANSARGLDPVQFLPISLLMTSALTPVATDDYSQEVRAVISRLPTDYSATAWPGDKPGGADELVIASIDEDSLVASGDERTFLFGSSYDGTDYTANATYATNVKKMFAALQASNGLLNLSIVQTKTSGITPTAIYPIWHGHDSGVLSPLIALDTWGFHTGHEKGPRGQRAVRCNRTGRAVGAGQLSQDGYLPGVWVTSDSWEPEDSRRRPPDISGTERDRQDEVTD